MIQYIPTGEELVKVQEFLDKIPQYLDEGKIKEEFYKTTDFWHPILDAKNEDLKHSAKFRMDQVRATNIGEKLDKHKESIKSNCIRHHVYILSSTDPNSPFVGELKDGNTRIIAARALEKNGTASRTYEVPAYVFVDKDLIKFVKRYMEAIQLLLNDHLPSNPSSKHTMMAKIRSRLEAMYNTEEGITPEGFKAVKKYYHFLVKSSTSIDAVGKWCSEAKKTIEANSAGIKHHVDKDHLRGMVKNAAFLLKEKVSHKQAKRSTVKPKKYVINTATAGLLEKEFANAMLRKAKDPAAKNHMMFHNTRVTSEDSLISNQLKTFEKISLLHSMTKVPIFDEAYAISQRVTHKDRETLLNYNQVKKLAVERELIEDESVNEAPNMRLVK